MTKRRGKTAAESEDRSASSMEVQAAIEGLTSAELLRLRRFARFRILLLGPRQMGNQANDLLQESITRTLSGERRWNRAGVDFFGHLIGTMRSISSHWAEQLEAGEAFPDSATGRVIPDGECETALERAPSAAPSAERAVAARQELELIEQALDEDPLASLILMGLWEGRKGPEIQEALGITQTEYETAMTRIRRTARRVLKGGADHA